MKNILGHTILLGALLLSSCVKELGLNCIDAEGQVEKREVSVEAFSKIQMETSVALILSEGEQKVEIEAASNIIDHLLDNSDVGSDKWTIDMKRCYNGPTVNIYLQLPEYVSLDIEGSGSIVSTEPLGNVDKLNIEINGTGIIDLSVLDANKLDIELKGSGDISVNAQEVTQHSCDLEGVGDISLSFDSGISSVSTLKGTGSIVLFGEVESQVINLEGTGSLLAHNLSTRTCIIDMKGGLCEVNVSEQLSINLEGPGDVCYLGAPELNSNIDGPGAVVDCN